MLIQYLIFQILEVVKEHIKCLVKYLEEQVEET